MKKTTSLDNLFVFREPEKGFKENSMRFLYTMSYFTSLERIGNGIDNFFIFEPEKEVKRGLHDASLHNVNFYEPGKKLEMDSDL